MAAAPSCEARKIDFMSADKEVLEVAGREVAISHPDKVLFPKAGHTKLDLVRYYLAVAEGALRGRRIVPHAQPRCRLALAGPAGSTDCRADRSPADPCPRRPQTTAAVHRQTDAGGRSAADSRAF